MKNRPICLLLCLLFLSFGSLSWAQDSQVQEKRLSPAVDTFVSDSPFLTWVGSERKQERYVNFGTNGGLSVIRGKYAGAGGHIYWRGTLIRFALSEIPPGSEILEARLFLYHYSVWGEQISIHRMLRDWTELGATWSEPCEGCDPWWQGWYEGNYVRVPTFSQRVTGIDRWFDWDVTGDVEAFLSGTSNYGWFLKSAETGGTDSTSASFYSKDSNNPTFRPYLQVRFRNAPPPLTVKITSPTDGTVVNTSPLTVTGTVSDPTATVTVNGITPSLSGNSFQTSIDLAEGQNIITAQATDQYGQTATDSVTVTLLTKGTVAGTVTDFQSGFSLSSATVSVTDALNVTETALTGADGTYAISNVASGAFSGGITKEGYAPYPVSGTISSGQTITINAALRPNFPTISNVAVSGITSSSAAITWNTDQPADSRVDYGTTTSYGNFVSDSTLTTAHRIVLTGLALRTTYHFRVTSKNAYSFAATSGDYAFTTLGPRGPVILSITYPRNEQTLSTSDTRVEGEVFHDEGLETGVVVNGILANIYGTTFVANQVPLTEGTNQITVLARDIKGNKETVSIQVTRNRGEHYVEIRANTDSGISPLEVLLSVDSSLPLSDVSLTFSGPASVEWVRTGEGEYRVTLSADGIYLFTATGLDSVGTAYQDSVAVTVLSKDQLDTLLRGKWEGMRTELLNGNIENVVSYVDESSEEEYREALNILSSFLPTIAEELTDIQFIEYVGNSAIYDIRTIREGLEFSFQVIFSKDFNGIWKINSF